MRRYALMLAVVMLLSGLVCEGALADTKLNLRRPTATPEATQTPEPEAAAEETETEAAPEAEATPNAKEKKGGVSVNFRLPLDETGGLPFDDAFKTVEETLLYEDPTIRAERFIKYNRDTVYNTYMQYVNITIADASQLRTSIWNGYEKGGGARVDVIGRSVNAVAAINGDFVKSHRDGYILRQGTVYRDNIERKCDILLIDEDGDFHIVPYDVDQNAVDKTQWEGKQVYNAFTFGPVLVQNDRIVLDKKADPAYADAPGRGQRSCIIQCGHLQYIFLTVKHITLEDLASLSIDLAKEFTGTCVCAYVLDGGFSSQLAFKGRLVNKPADNTARADMSDIVYVCSSWSGR